MKRDKELSVLDFLEKDKCYLKKVNVAIILKANENVTPFNVIASVRVLCMLDYNTE